MSYPENWLKDIPYLPLQESDKVPKELKIGQKYHCTWASSSAMVWILIGISNNNQAILQTPKTKRIVYTHINNLRLINKDAEQAAKIRYKKSLKN
jgi:hypothetical protein